jgi:hypothetical protein
MVEQNFGDKRLLEKLIQIGVALTSEIGLDSLLRLIVKEARWFTCADAGSLYVREGEKLRFVVSQNDTLIKRLGANKAKQLFKTFDMPIDKNSLAGYVAWTGKTLNIPDAYKDEPADYKLNLSFDKQTGYHTKSLLIFPLKDPGGEILGVLQLINSMDVSANVVEFSPKIEELVHSLASLAAVAIKNAQLTDALKKAYYDTIIRLSVAAEYRDKITGGHLKRVSHYAQIIAKYMGFSNDEAEHILYTAPMHDVGKLGVPDAVLQKEGTLTPEERSLMEKHTLIGAEIFSDPGTPIFEMAQVLALNHHERYDGKGYPNGLENEEIPLAARIIAVADVFDALAAKRQYKDAIPLEKIYQILKDESGTHFDPTVVDAFFKGLDEILQIKEKFKD